MAVRQSVSQTRVYPAGGWLARLGSRPRPGPAGLDSTRLAPHLSPSRRDRDRAAAATTTAPARRAQWLGPTAEPAAGPQAAVSQPPPLAAVEADPEPLSAPRAAHGSDLRRPRVHARAARAPRRTVT